jgi:hypothetical protein
MLLSLSSMFAEFSMTTAMPRPAVIEQFDTLLEREAAALQVRAALYVLYWEQLSIQMLSSITDPCL